MDHVAGGWAERGRERVGWDVERLGEFGEDGVVGLSSEWKVIER